ncbi:MAG: PAS domain-containing sensor histidine kinase [Candidatus Cloacimonetes bacterium]|nr:PAS domain-containing sensor histidine kinase [Candidatus Cloacimonadota bacterium]
MTENNNFVKYDVNLKEWINKLYTDIDSMRSFLEKHSFNVTRADLDLSSHYRENNCQKLEYEILELEPVFNGHDYCTDFVIRKLSNELSESDFFTEREVTAKTLSDFLDNGGKKLLSSFKESYQYKKPVIFEYFHQLNHKAYRIITQPGDILIVLLQDITSEQIYHLDMKRYENLFSKAQEISSSGFFQYNTYNQELYVTEGALNIFECPRNMNATERIRLKDYIRCVHDDDKEHVLSMISEEKLTSNLDYEHRITLREKVKYVHVIGSAFYDPIDDSISLIGTVEDITSLKEVINELKRVKTILNEIEKVSQIAYWEYEFSSDNFTGTSEAIDILGVTEADLPLSFGDFLHLVHEDEREKFYAAFHQSLSEHRDWENDFRIVDKFGVEKKVNFICRNRFDSKNKPLKSRGFLSNQTELKNYKHDSRKLKQVKEELSALQSSFEQQLSDQLFNIRKQDNYSIQKFKFEAINDLLAHLSRHWLDALNVVSAQIHNWAEAYEFDELTPESFQQMYDTVKSQIAGMSKKMNFFQKYNSTGKNVQRIELKSALEEMLEISTESLSAQGILLENAIEPDCQLDADIQELSQALQEIINNSRDELLFRGTEKPVIKIKSRRDGEAIIITISDNAGGIAAGDLDRIFEPYYSSTEKSNATGLGLYMSKMIIEKNMKGTIIAQNHNSGALFEISVPAVN